MQQSYRRSSSNNLSHVHPDIQASLQEYHKCYAGWVVVQRLLEDANLTLKDLPYLTNLVDVAWKNWLCYNHFLGLCQHGRSCEFRRKGGHVSGKDLPTQFIQELIAKLAPGLHNALSTTPQPRNTPNRNVSMGGSMGGHEPSG